jgi:hypothetical protein
MFENLITPQFKQIFKDSIDTLLAQNSLSVPCTLKYENTKRDLCYNCEFDAISNRSANIPKANAPVGFARFTVCPVCHGFGYIDKSSDETIYLAIIFDSKYWLNWDSNTVKISDGMVQSLSKIDVLPKLKNCKEMIMDTNLSNYDNYRYSLAGDPQPAGLGSNDYIISMWQRS